MCRQKHSRKPGSKVSYERNIITVLFLTRLIPGHCQTVKRPHAIKIKSKKKKKCLKSTKRTMISLIGYDVMILRTKLCRGLAAGEYRYIPNKLTQTNREMSKQYNQTHIRLIPRPSDNTRENYHTE